MNENQVSTRSPCSVQKPYKYKRVNQSVLRQIFLEFGYIELLYWNSKITPVNYSIQNGSALYTNEKACEILTTDRSHQQSYTNFWDYNTKLLNLQHLNISVKHCILNMIVFKLLFFQHKQIRTAVK